jgi:zinc protease
MMLKSVVIALLLAPVALAGSETFRLANGLEVVLNENHASPMAAAMVFVKAGSKYEQPQQNGVTHFLEHLLFNGTSSRSQEQIEPVIESFGGYINAFTRKELTGYLVLMPREYIDTGLAVMSDMIFSSIFPAEKVEKERGIVSEEIRRDTDSPDYAVENAFDALRFRGTPYARPVLGDLNIIASITRDEIMEYYRAHYVPQNMSLLLLGDFDRAAMKASVNRYFGSVFARTGPARAEAVSMEGPAASDRVFEVQYIALPAPRLLVSIPAFAPLAPTYPALEVWAAYLNLAGTSPFLATLLDGEQAVATDAGTRLEIREGAADLVVDVTLKPAVDSAAALDAVFRGLSESVRQLPDAATLADLITAAQAEEYGLLEKLHYYGIMRAQEIGVLGWDHASHRVERMSEVTLRDLQEAVSVYKNGFNQYAALYVTAPTEAPAAAVRAADRYSMRTFPNGLVAVVKSNPDSRMFGATVLFGNRSASEPPGKSGLVDFAHRLLPKGTQELDEGDVARALASVGATLTTADNPAIPYDDFYTTPQFSFVKLAALDSHARQALEILYDLVYAPRFDSAQVVRMQGELGAVYGRQEQSASYVARRSVLKAFFGDGPLASDVLGDPAVTGAVSPAELSAFWQEYAAPGNTVLAMATTADPDTVMRWIAETFGDRPSLSLRTARAQQAPRLPDSLSPINIPMQKAQVQICMGRPGCGPSDTDAPALAVAVRLLSDRLAAQLREKEGLAYSVGASVDFAPKFGWILCTMGTAPENRERAISGIKEQAGRLLSEPPDETELLSAKNKMVGRALMRRLSRDTQCYYMALSEFLGLGYNYDEEFEAKVKAVTAEDIARVAGTYIAPDTWVLCTAGPAPGSAPTKMPGSAPTKMPGRP